MIGIISAQCDLLMPAETWLISKALNLEILLPGYEKIRRYQVGLTQGGILEYIKNYLGCEGAPTNAYYPK